MSSFESATGFTAPAPEELATLFPDYEIRSLIAMGGMGAVYRAVQRALDREVAIKILPAEFSDDPAFCASFEAEAKAMAKLNHPNLIGVFDFGEVGGMLFIVMEFVDGQSLHEACQGAALDPAEVIRLVSGISEGLAHAHEHGILHRDIKPANILLDASLRPKIGDFGLARPVDKKVEVGEAIFGTPGYTAPEVLVPPHAVDQRADIFSLGVLLHELLTGALPEADPRPPSLICRCDPRLDAVVRKATHPQPRSRYEGAAQIAAQLHQIAHTAGPRVLRTAAASPAAKARIRPASSLKSSPKGGGGVVSTLVLLAVVAVAGYFYRADIANWVQPPAEADSMGGQEAPPVAEKPRPVEALPAEAVEPELAAPELAAPELAAPELAPAQAKYDVDGFLKHARAVMVRRCAPYVKTRNQALERNVTNFRYEGRRLSRNNLSSRDQRAAEENLKELAREYEANRHRIGHELAGDLKYKPWMQELFGEFQEKEKAIDAKLSEAFAKESKVYLRGLKKKIDQLLADGDPLAAEQVRAEVDKLNRDSGYFSDLINAEIEP